MDILLVNKPYSQGASERFRRPLSNFKEGQPQSFVIFTLLLTIYINDLRAKFAKDAVVSAYAGDLLVARNASNNYINVASSQPEVDRVVAWSVKARLTHNTSKCETAFFIQDCEKAACQPNITIDEKRMFCNPFPVFLGVRYDLQLTFAEHMRKLCQSMSGRFNLLLALGDTTCEWHTSACRQVYIAIARCMLEYVATAWAPWLSATSTSKLDKVQLVTTRAITGHVRSMSVEAVLAESKLPPI